MTAKLHQVLAAEKTVRNRANREITAHYNHLSKPEALQGIERHYDPLADEEGEGEKLPSESTRVQVKGEEILAGLKKHFTDMWDITATRDYANLNAVADVVVDGVVIFEKAPTSFLIWLEKQLTDLHTTLYKLPTLDPAEDWKYDENTAVYRTEPKKTHRTKKIPRVLVKAVATDKHQADTEVYHEDKVVGYWNTTKFSGAFPRTRVNQLAERVTKLQTAVKYAREEANSVEAPSIEVGEAIFNYLLSS